ncbi:anti-sigma-28 factor, FlgM family [Modicisalibacter muralis]|uniref:Negative regulator of flagellin synthesis n=1 Tax=Modicisalibacter muralis TaxID=119000 RepID=A0A1G9FSN1_9GAMM|nr:flagellar biosynthesis anti-sigma factor FlgM [Halomonas muralis]SDK91335.1 anti-sigma-28 factor, FlgM family [Halomonas muralis]
MKIDSSHPLHRATQGEVNKAAQPAKGESVTQSTNPAAITHLSDSARDDSQDIDAARVAEIRQAISEGRLDIRAERIADGLIDSVRDLLGDTSS